VRRIALYVAVSNVEFPLRERVAVFTKTHSKEVDISYKNLKKIIILDSDFSGAQGKLFYIFKYNNISLILLILQYLLLKICNFVHYLA